MSDFDYVTVGHVTMDVLADGTRRPGGGAFYSALQAARLGLRTLILTKGAPRELGELLAPYGDELAVRIFPAQHTTTLATSWMGSQRSQRVLAWAGAITEPIAVDTSILHLAAVARETPTQWQGHAEFVGITPQGLVRDWDESGEMTLVPLKAHAFPAHFDAAVLNEAELAHCPLLLSTPRQLLAVTAGSAPTRLYEPDGETLQAPALFVEKPREDLGAGDVFAAAFFVALHEGRSPLDAVLYANAAAAVRIAGEGPGAVGDQATIARALRR